MKNLKIDRKKLISLAAAIGMMITPSLATADITSYGIPANLTDGRKIVLYYSNDKNRSFIELNGELGFVDSQYIADKESYDPNNYFSEVNSDDYIRVDDAILYSDPDGKNPLTPMRTITKGAKAHIFAKSEDGYYIVYVDNAMGFVHESAFKEKEAVVETVVDPMSQVDVAKITGNNVNVRSSPSTKQKNVIGFCDMSDKFTILGVEGDFYKIDYLGQTGYVSSKYVRKETMDKKDLEVEKMVYLKKDSPFYSNLNGGIYCYLPAYQNILVLSNVGDYYRVRVDGVIGYVEKSATKSLTKTTIVVDLSRQILKVYKNGKEVFRCHVITGAQSMQTNIGCHVVGHHMEGFTFEDNDIYNEYWIQFDNNIGIHPADANAGKGWQKPEYFVKVADNAYENWAKGRGKTYPNHHGSHGCVNTQIKDTREIYALCSVKDNVLVIEQNDLVKYNLLNNPVYQDSNVLK